MSGFSIARNVGITRGKSKSAAIKSNSIWDEIDYIEKDSARRLSNIKDTTEVLGESLKTIAMVSDTTKNQEKEFSDVSLVEKEMKKKGYHLQPYKEPTFWDMITGKSRKYTFSSEKYVEDIVKDSSTIKLEAVQIKAKSMYDESKDTSETVKVRGGFVGPTEVHESRQGDLENLEKHRKKSKADKLARKLAEKKKVKERLLMKETDPYEIDWESGEINLK